MKPTLFLILLATLAGCGPSSEPDAGDAQTGGDATDVREPDDVAVSMDVVGMDSVDIDATTDTPVAEGGGDGGDTGGDVGGDGRVVPTGCNPAEGIECDGDWTDRCTPACAATECCSPQRGRFQCVPRDSSGDCPAADLWVDADRIRGRYTVEWRYFAPDSCALMERCVAAPGWRRLLRFDTWTPNTGGADMYLGVPSPSARHFEYSACHRHYHFNSYAEYWLNRPDGTVAATGHKQAFCLLDYYQYPGTNNAGAHYTCTDQGIQRGWQDVYGRGLDCQWVDVTDVPAGDYSLHIAINTEHILLESDYSNNDIDVPVTIPARMTGDPTSPCAASTTGEARECGWTLAGTHTCTPGTMVQVGCSARCGLGTCTGDTVIRVCPGAMPCLVSESLASNDDSGCGGMTCRMGAGECCSMTPRFACPASGEYTVLWGPFRSDGTATCDVAVR